MLNELPQNQATEPVVQAEAPKGFLESMFDETVVGPMLEKLIEKDPDAAKEYFSIGKDYVAENGQIDRQAFLKETTVTEKVWALLSIWLGDNCLDQISNKLGKDSELVEFEDFDGFKKTVDTKIVQLSDDNIIFPLDSFFSNFWKSFGSGEVKGKAQVKLPRKSSIVVPKINKMSSFVTMKLLAKKEGINLKVYSSDETIPEPADNEVQIVMIDHELLPNPEKPTYDPKLIENCRRLYERGRAIWIDPVLVEALKQPQPVPEIKVEAKAPTVPETQQTVQSQVAQATAPAAPAAAPATPITNPAPVPTQAPGQAAK